MASLRSPKSLSIFKEPRHWLYTILSDKMQEQIKILSAIKAGRTAKIYGRGRNFNRRGKYSSRVTEKFFEP
jgi:hypothetical protein